MKKMTWIAVAALAAVLVAVAGHTMQETSKMEFCLSCHEMSRYDFELKRSPHALDKDKKPIECAQCHLPLSVGPSYLAAKSYLGVKDLVMHAFGDTSDMDRLKLQHAARRFVPDENCQACHKDLRKNVKGEPISLEGKKAHDSWLGEDGRGRRTCVGCHANMAHLPVFDRHYDVNAKFAAKLPLEGE